MISHKSERPSFTPDFGLYIDILVKKTKEHLEKELKNKEDIINQLKETYKRRDRIEFLEYYKKLVLSTKTPDERIEQILENSGEFLRGWALSRIEGKEKVLNEPALKEIGRKAKDESNLVEIFVKYFFNNKRNVSFFSKILHCLYPERYPPIDSKVRKNLKLESVDPLISFFVITRVYDESKELIKSKGGEILQKVEESVGISFNLSQVSHMRMADLLFWRNKKK